ncbi:hypothetical protein [Streptomyces sp. NPDC093261]|uniref:hypothetical protein n=1 Tax=Streptomyces sp. NPDC093261 TaxID=3366037 RepID=UPI0037FF34A7
MTAAVEPGPSLEDGVIVEARHVDDEQAGFGQVRFTDRVHVCQYVFVDSRGSVQAPDSPGRVSCQWRRHALETQTRHARLRALDLAGMQLLQILFDAARVHGAEVRLTPVAVPAYWSRIPCSAST